MNCPRDAESFSLESFRHRLKHYAWKRFSNILYLARWEIFNAILTIRVIIFREAQVDLLLLLSVCGLACEMVGPAEKHEALVSEFMEIHTPSGRSLLEADSEISHSQNVNSVENWKSETLIPMEEKQEKTSFLSWEEMSWSWGLCLLSPKSAFSMVS